MAIFQKVIQKKLSFYRIRWVIFLAPHAHWIGCLSCNLEPFFYCSGSNREGKVGGSWSQQVIPLDPLVCMHPSTTTSLVYIVSGIKAAYLAFLSSELPNGAAFQPTKRTTSRQQVKQILCHKITLCKTEQKTGVVYVFWGSSHFLSSPIGLGFVQGGRKKLNIRGLNIQQIPDGYNVAFGCDALDAEVPDTIKNNWRNPWL